MTEPQRLPDPERTRLLSLARRAIRSVLYGETPPEATGTGASCSGVFVSIHRGDRLRACLGILEPTGPVEQAIVNCAIAAATNDTRFPPLAADEMDGCRIDISILTPARVIADISGVEVGRHGVVVSDGERRGLLLPHVATQYGWDRETFLSQACRKAGLPQDAWTAGALIEVFEAEEFGESAHETGPAD